MKKILDGSRERLLKGRKKCADIAAMDKQMSDIVAKIDQVTSFSSTSVIGMTKESAYLEVTFFLTSGRSYVVVVSAPLSDCPPAILDKLKQLLDTKSKEASKTK
jgi:hypothetical protein